MTQIDQRYVAYFDMLGMSQLTVRDPELAWQALSGLNQAQQEILRLTIEVQATAEMIRDRVRAFTFSDTIVMFSLSDGLPDTWAIVVLATELFARALHYCIPIRGAIAHGRFLFNLERNLFAGPPLVSAYRLAEEAQWLGIRVDGAVAARAQDVPLHSFHGRPTIIEWEVPVRSGERVVSHVVDWVQTHRANFRVTPPIGVAAFYQAFSRLFGPLEALPPEARRKYENTVEFINERLQPSETTPRATRVSERQGNMSEDEDREAFVRWQGITITQLGHVVNLILGLSVAVLGFAVSLLLKGNFLPTSWDKLALALALVSLSASVGLGIWCVINRLLDFRITMAIARAKQTGAVAADLGKLRAISDAHGRRTWRLFWWQIGTFAAGVTAIVFAMSGTITAKLL